MNIRKKFTVAAASLICSAGVFAPAVSNAVTPDPGYVISSFWTHSNAFREWFDWRAFVGWGGANAINAVALTLSGASEGEVTKAAFTALCGGTAAGLLANWRPVDGPGGIANMKSIAKSASITSVSIACGWVAKNTFAKMDNEIYKAQNWQKSAPAYAKQDLQTAYNVANKAGYQAKVAFDVMSNLRGQLDYKRMQYENYYCDRGQTGFTGATCIKLATEMVDLAEQLNTQAKIVLDYGNAIQTTIKAIDGIIKT